MATASFFDQAPDPQADPLGYMRQQGMANALMARGAQSPQGSTAGGMYQAPGAASYATQLAAALAGGYKNNQLRDSARASDIINGGTGQTMPYQKMGNWFSGLFSGGAGGGA